MPLPEPSDDEDQSTFVGRCMSNDTVRSEFPDQTQRLAVCHSQFRKTRTKNRKASDDISLLLDELARAGKL
jgi:hypothetical protein